MNKLTWNEKIKNLREQNNLTQEEAAEKCNTTKKNYWLWEKGRNFPRKNSQIAIAAAFNVHVEDIFEIE